MGGVKDNRITERSHNRQCPKIDDQIIVAKRGPPLGDPDFFASGLARLLDRVLKILHKEQTPF